MSQTDRQTDSIIMPVLARMTQWALMHGPLCLA